MNCNSLPKTHIQDLENLKKEQGNPLGCTQGCANGHDVALGYHVTSQLM
jgi:hypothetical protein